METRAIEVTVISATDLKKAKKIQQGNCCYAVAYIYPTVQAATALAENAGSSPTWNFALTLGCYESHLHPPASKNHNLTVDIFRFTKFLGRNKLLGTAMLSLEAAMAAFAKDGAKQESILAMVPVRKPSGKARGTLTLSVRLGPKLAQIAPAGGGPFAALQVPNSPAGYGLEGYAASGSAYNQNPSTSKFAKSSSTFADEDIVTGYPAKGKLPASAPPFAPLGAMPTGELSLQPTTYGRHVGAPLCSRPRRRHMQCRRGCRTYGLQRRRRRVPTGLLILGGIALAILL